jgi:suppressor for copper-sensitivity B
MIGVAYYLPFKYLKNQVVREQEIDEVWQVFSLKNITHAIKNQRIVLVDITADWCVTCKYNKFMVLDTKYMMNFLEKNNIVTIRGDYTTANQEINTFLQTMSDMVYH